MEKVVKRGDATLSDDAKAIVGALKEIKPSSWATLYYILGSIVLTGFLIVITKKILVPMIIAIFLLFLSVKFSDLIKNYLLNFHNVFLKVPPYRWLAGLLGRFGERVLALKKSTWGLQIIPKSWIFPKLWPKGEQTFIWKKINTKFPEGVRLHLWRIIPIWKLVPKLGIVSVLASILFLFGGLALSYSIIMTNAENVKPKISIYQANINATIDKPKQWLNAYPNISKRVNKHIETIAQTINNNVNISSIVASISGTIGGLASQSFIVFLFYMFFAGSLKSLSTRIKNLDKLNSKVDIAGIANDISEKITIYLKVKTGASFATALCAYFIFRGMGLDFADACAIGVFFLNFIPNVGSLFSALPPILVTFFMFGFSYQILVIAGGLIAINIVIGSVLEPKFMGEKLNLAAWVILAALLGFSEMLGTSGAFFCVIITAFAFQIMANLEESKFIAIIISDKGEIN